MRAAAKRRARLLSTARPERQLPDAAFADLAVAALFVVACLARGAARAARARTRHGAPGLGAAVPAGTTARGGIRGHVALTNALRVAASLDHRARRTRRDGRQIGGTARWGSRPRRTSRRLRGGRRPPRCRRRTRGRSRTWGPGCRRTRSRALRSNSLSPGWARTPDRPGSRASARRLHLGSRRPSRMLRAPTLPSCRCSRWREPQACISRIPTTGSCASGLPRPDARARPLAHIVHAMVRAAAERPLALPGAALCRPRARAS